MGFINNPLPSSMKSECKKCGKILASFIDPRQSFGPDKIIPPQILANAKGLAILTVFKAGFLGSGRFGSGLVVARLADGSWSAPSGVGTVGGGFGGQIGFELTDFVFILNDASAVKTFAQVGSITLGGNVSIAAGPVGRNAEAAGAASLKSVSGIFAYSKTKGLFAGVSLEGSVLIERRDANEKMYNRRVTARSLLEGSVPVPGEAEPLMRVLNSRIFAGTGGNNVGADSMYNDIPVYDSTQDDTVWQGRTGSAYGEGVRSNKTGQTSMGNDDFARGPSRASTWQDDVYDRRPSYGSRANPNETFDSISGRGRSNSAYGDQSDYVYSDKAPTRPTAPKPSFGNKPAVAAKPNFASKPSFGNSGSARPQPGQAIAKFTFDPDQPGDLGFKKGEIITILKKTDNAADWWTGRIGTREGIFPSNYVELA